MIPPDLIQNLRAAGYRELALALCSIEFTRVDHQGATDDLARLLLLSAAQPNTGAAMTESRVTPLTEDEHLDLLSNTGIAPGSLNGKQIASRVNDLLVSRGFRNTSAPMNKDESFELFRHVRACIAEHPTGKTSAAEALGAFVNSLLAAREVVSANNWRRLTLEEFSRATIGSQIAHHLVKSDGESYAYLSTGSAKLARVSIDSFGRIQINAMTMIAPLRLPTEEVFTDTLRAVLFIEKFIGVRA